MGLEAWVCVPSWLFHVLILTFQESKDLAITKDSSLYIKAYKTCKK